MSWSILCSYDTVPQTTQLKKKRRLFLAVLQAKVKVLASSEGFTLCQKVEEDITGQEWV